MSELIETRSATLERVSPDLMEVRFKPGIKLDASGVREILTQRARLCTGEPYNVLAILEPETDFEMEVMTRDHYQGFRLDGCTKALAFAANDMLNERLASLFFAYFPQKFNTRVFLQEAEARQWLVQEVRSRSMN